MGMKSILPFLISAAMVDTFSGDVAVTGGSRGHVKKMIMPRKKWLKRKKRMAITKASRKVNR